MCHTATLSGLLNKADLCQKLGISPRTIENMIKDGKFPPAVRIGKYVYWSEKSIARWHDALFTSQEDWRPTA